jgi:hypothetical protein
MYHTCYHYFHLKHTFSCLLFIGSSFGNGASAWNTRGCIAEGGGWLAYSGIPLDSLGNLIISIFFFGSFISFKASASVKVP